MLLHAGFYLLDHQPDLVCLGSLAFGVALWAALGGITNILHPDSPVYTSESFLIQAFFTVLLILALLAGWQIAWFLVRRIK